MGIVFPALLPVAFFVRLGSGSAMAELAGPLLALALGSCALILIMIYMPERLVVRLGALGYIITFIIVFTFVKRTNARFERLKRYERLPPPPA
jgi:hypothetical protein